MFGQKITGGGAKAQKAHSRFEIRDSTQISTNQIASTIEITWHEKMAENNEKITVQQGKTKFSFLIEKTGFNLSESK
jgi:hypothetical protein